MRFTLPYAQKINTKQLLKKIPSSNYSNIVNGESKENTFDKYDPDLLEETKKLELRTWASEFPPSKTEKEYTEAISQRSKQELDQTNNPIQSTNKREAIFTAAAIGADKFAQRVLEDLQHEYTMDASLHTRS